MTEKLDIISNRIEKTELVEWRKISWLQGELKSLSKESFNKLKQSLKVNNFIQPFNVWQNGEQNGELWCLDGHHRLKAMQDLEKDGITIPDKLPANFVQCKDKKEAKKLVLIYSSIYARVSDETLYEYLNVNDLNFEELKLEIDIPELNLDKFEDGYIKDQTLQDAEPQIDRAAEINKRWKVKTGDLYSIGEHRLLCGDSTKREDVERVMDGKRINMIFIDPPYAVNYGADQDVLNMKSGGKFRKVAKPIIGDSLTTKDCAEKIWRPAFKNMYELAEDNCSFYMTMCQGGDQMMMMMMMSENWQIKHELIWVKNAPVFSMGRLNYDYQHEPILFGWKKKHNFYGRGQFTKSIWEINKPSKSEFHPTMKPIELMVNALLNSSIENQIVYDGFLGSGSTMLAAANTTRKCYGIEISPDYCAVILERMQTAFPEIKIEKLN